MLSGRELPAWRRLMTPLLVLALLGPALLGSRPAAASIGTSTITLPSGSIQITGAAAGDVAGFTVAGVGDVNGDGFADLLVGAPFANANGSDSGAASLLFGKASGFGAVTLDNSGLDPSVGVLIKGAGVGNQAGWSVAGAGDVNGDGFADLLVGAPNAAANGGQSGAASLLFGKASGWGTVNLDNSGLDPVVGVLIKGAADSNQAGWSLAGVGDVNGDGFADLLVGAPFASANGSDSGPASLLFGKASGWGTITLDNSGLDPDVGVLIKGAAGGDRAGFAVAGGGDVNGDGLADLLVGAPFASANGAQSGAASLLFGKASGWGTITLDNSGLDPDVGVLIKGAAGGDQAGFAVAGAGDVNGDGFADLLVGAPNAAANGGDSGAASLLFGKASGWGTVNLDNSGLDPVVGVLIKGAVVDDQAGWSLAGAGDVNGDGFADLLVGVSLADANGGDSGAVSLLFGKASGFGTITLDDSGLDPSVGVLIKGAAAFDLAGNAVAGVGDVNGDGLADLLVGAPSADGNGNNSGAAYLLLAAPPGKASQFGDSGANTLTGSSSNDRLVGHRGDDTLLGKGGTDVLYGGADDDVLAVSSTSFRRLDGGTGFNTLRFEGSDLDLTNRRLASRLVGIDAIDLSGPGSQHITLDRLAVVNLDDLSNTLLVFRGPDDTVEKGSGWQQLADEPIAGFPFQVFRRGAALLKIGQVSGPSGLTVQPGSAKATVSFTPLPSSGTCPISGYVVQVFQGQTLVKTVETTSSPVLIQDLQNGVPYTFTVQAKSCAGLGPASSSGLVTLGPATVRPDGVFLNGSGQPLQPFGGDNAYDSSGGGGGGSNVASGDGPTIKRGSSRSIPFRIENDGSKADRIKLKAITSSRSLSGITITVNGLHIGDGAAELAANGGKLDGTIVVQVGASVPTGKYVARLTLQANGTSDPSQSDSVTLRFVVS